MFSGGLGESDLSDAPKSVNIQIRTAMRLQRNPPLRFREIGFVDLEADELFHAAALRRHRRISNAEKRIEHRVHARDSVQLDAIFSERDRERGRMRALFCPALDRFVRNKPCVSAAAQIAPARMRPAGDVAFILIRNAEREPVDVDLAVDREMENVFVAIIQKSLRADRFEMSIRLNVVVFIFKRD